MKSITDTRIRILISWIFLVVCLPVGILIDSQQLWLFGPMIAWGIRIPELSSHTESRFKKYALSLIVLISVVIGCFQRYWVGDWSHSPLRYSLGASVSLLVIWIVFDDYRVIKKIRINSVQPSAEGDAVNRAP